VWESDQDGNITSLNDSRVHRISLTYNYSRREINVSNKTSISNATDPAIAGTDKESFDAAMAYFKTESGKYNDGKIIYSRLEDENGEGQIRKKYFEDNVSRFKDFTVNGNSLAWVEGPVADPEVYFSSNAKEDDPVKINISNLTSIRDIKLQSTENNSYKFLTYRGKSANDRKAVYYKMRANDSWIRDRPLTSNTSGFVYWQPSTTVGENNSKFVTAVAGKNFSKDNQKNDIFSVQHEFRPDLKLRVNLNNETENLTSSDKVEVQLNVSNVGDGPTKKNVELVIFNGTQHKIYDQMFSQISAGESQTNETLVKLGKRGVFKSSIDIQDRIKELSEDNNNVTIRPLKPNLEVYSVNSSRKGDQAELNITFNNTGDAIAENIPYVVNVNDSEVENGSIDVLRNASSKKVSVNISAEKVSAYNLTSIEINPDRNIKETNFSDNTWEGRLLRPDLSLRKSRFSYYKYEDSQEKVIEIRIDNSGGTKAFTTVNILDNQTVLGQETVSIGPSSKSNLSNSTFVNISTTDIKEDQRYTVAAPVEYDRNNRNNAVSLDKERSFNQISADEDPEKGGGGGGSGGGGGGFALPSNENENNRSQSGGTDANSTDKNMDSINDTDSEGDESSIKVSKQIGKEETVEFGIQEKLNHSSLSKIEVESNTSGVLNISYQGLQKDKPEEVSRPQSKEIYNYMEIKSSIDDKNLVRAKIRFRVDKKWLKTQEGNKEDITMKRYENGAWKSLETVFVNSSENNHKFKSFSSGFSYFSITLDENRSSGNKSQNDVEREKSRVDTYQVTLALLGILAFGLIIGIYWIRVYKE
jgi:PGF-pre-PGF domain-containing protein